MRIWLCAAWLITLLGVPGAGWAAPPRAVPERPSVHRPSGPTARAPYLAIRGDRVRLEPLAGKGFPTDLFSPSRWSPYLEELASFGYNLLELYGPAASGEALLAHLVPCGRGLAERPSIERRRNLAGLQHLTALAGRRGIGLVVTSGVPDGMAGAHLSRAVQALAEAVPGLAGIGIEAGSDSAAARAAAAGLQAARGFHGALYLDSRLPRTVVESLAPRLGGRVVMRLSLDAGELARPYLPLGDPPAAVVAWETSRDLLEGLVIPPGLWPGLGGAGSAATPEEHLRLPRRYAVIWQIGGPPGGAGLPWLDAIFARRAARFCASGGALGFVVGSPGGLFPRNALAAGSVPPAPRLKTGSAATWWHALWGAVGRDPDHAEGEVRRRFGQQFGVDAGDFIFNSLALLSRMSVAVNAAVPGGAALPAQEQVDPAIAAGASPAPEALKLDEPSRIAALFLITGLLPETESGSAAPEAPELDEPARIAALFLMSGLLPETESGSAAPEATKLDEPARMGALYLMTGLLPERESGSASPAAGLESDPTRAEMAALPPIEVEQEAPDGDPRGFASIAAWADSLLTGIPDGRPGPIERAHDLAWYSMRIRGDLDTITLLRPRDAAEWQRLQVSLLSGAHLADYYARALSAAAYRHLFELTDDEMARTIAASHQQGAHEAGAAFWRVVEGSGSTPRGSRRLLAGAAGLTDTPEKLAALTAPPASRPLPPPLPPELASNGPGVSGAGGDILLPTLGTVGSAPMLASRPETPQRPPSEAVALERSDGASPATAQPEIKVKGSRATDPPETPMRAPLAIRHIPARRGTPSRALRIDATVAHGRDPVIVILRYWLPDATEARETPMTVNFATEQFFAATIAGESLQEGILRYQIEARGENEVRYWPGPDGEATWSVAVRADTEGPRLQARHVADRDGLVRIEATATDTSGVARVLIYWRALRADCPWRSVIMRGEKDIYRAELALPREGLAYCVEADDRWGNARCFPEPRRETPYVLVTGPNGPSPSPQAASGSASSGSGTRSGAG